MLSLFDKSSSIVGIMTSSNLCAGSDSSFYMHSIESFAVSYTAQKIVMLLTQPICTLLGAMTWIF